MKKMRNIGLLLLCISIFLVGCQSPAAFDNIYDSDEKIVMQDQFEAQNEENLKLENGSYQYTAESFSGAKTIWQYDAKEGESITFAYDLSVYKGNGKLVLIQPDQTILKLAASKSRGEGNVRNPDSVITTVEGLYQLKVVGAGSPKLSITLNFSHGNWKAS